MQRTKRNEPISFQKGHAVKFDKLNSRSRIETKLDGARVGVTVNRSNVEFWSRSSITFKYDELKKFFERMPDGFYDGEMIYDSGKHNERTKIIGRLNSAYSGNHIRDNENVVFVAFDYLTAVEFERKKCRTPLKDRIKALDTFLQRNARHNRIGNTYRVLVDRPDFITLDARDEDKVIALYNEALAKGYEGVMIKDLESFYNFRKDYTWMKLKEWKTIDLKCIGFTPGLGKYTDMIGSLICESKDGTLQVDVGSGMTDADRAKDSQEYVGKIIEIKYNSYIDSSKKGFWSTLSFPIFVQVRHDLEEGE